MWNWELTFSRGDINPKMFDQDGSFSFPVGEIWQWGSCTACLCAVHMGHAAYPTTVLLLGTTAQVVLHLGGTQRQTILKTLQNPKLPNCCRVYNKNMSSRITESQNLPTKATIWKIWEIKALFRQSWIHLLFRKYRFPFALGYKSGRPATALQFTWQLHQLLPFNSDLGCKTFAHRVYMSGSLCTDTKYTI